MHRYLLLLFLTCSLAVGVSLVGADQPDAASIDRLIEQMSSADFANREKAYKQLRSIGEPALKALQKAAVDNKDVGVRRQAGLLAAAIQQQVDANRILKPRRLRLTYKNTPLEQAVADFQKKTGCNMVLKDPDKKLAGRRLTLDTGEVSFWEALDRFCAEAGLVETDLQPKPSRGRSGAMFQIQAQPRNAPPAPQPPQQPLLKQVSFKARNQAAQPGAVGTLRLGGDAGNSFQRGSSSAPLRLQGGKQSSAATYYFGAFRLRAFPLSPEQAERSKIALSLQLAVQPGFGIAHVGLISIDKAIDDQGRSLDYLREPVRRIDPGMRALLRRLGMDDSDKVADHRYSIFPLRFQAKNPPSRSLKEVTGSIAVSVLMPAEELMHVGNAFQAIGRQIEGERGAAIKILEAVRDAAGQVRLQLELTMPRGIAPNTPRKDSDDDSDEDEAVAPEDVPFVDAARAGLALADGKSRVLPESVHVKRGDASGSETTRKLEVIFPAAEGRQPAELIFSGRCVVTLEVSFALKNVLLK